MTCVELEWLFDGFHTNFQHVVETTKMLPMPTYGVLQTSKCQISMTCVELEWMGFTKLLLLPIYGCLFVLQTSKGLYKLSVTCVKWEWLFWWAFFGGRFTQTSKGLYKLLRWYQSNILLALPLNDMC